jgi:hypothetical protein
MISSSTVSPADIAHSERELLLRARFEAWMRRLMEHPDLHARFLNTLSLLEHIGSMKIARSQSGSAITGEILLHLAEETRHAAYLKKCAGKLGALPGADYRDEYLLAGAAARSYFARLDVTVRTFVRERVTPERWSIASYRLVTWLVERRAMWLYPAYQSIVEETALRLSVRSIVGEETRHLREIEEGLAELELEGLEPLVREEEKLFARAAETMMAGPR